MAQTNLPLAFGMAIAAAVAADKGWKMFQTAFSGGADAKTGGVSAPAGGGKGGTPAQNQTLGKAMMLAMGWPASEWPALQKLWQQESGWSTTARNPSSGAYGIPQSLGHGKLPADARGQIAWGLHYIKQRYGSPSAAWAHEQANNWY